MECCGVTGPENYGASEPRLKPSFSCCPPDESPETTDEIKRSNCLSSEKYYTEGCEEKVLSAVHSAGLTVIVCGILFCFLEVICYVDYQILLETTLKEISTSICFRKNVWNSRISKSDYLKSIIFVFPEFEIWPNRKKFQLNSVSVVLSVKFFLFEFFSSGSDNRRLLICSWNITLLPVVNGHFFVVQSRVSACISTIFIPWESRSSSVTGRSLAIQYIQLTSNPGAGTNESVNL